MPALTEHLSTDACGQNTFEPSRCPALRNPETSKTQPQTSGNKVTFPTLRDFGLS